MRFSRWLFIGAAVIGALLLFLLFTLWFIPDSELQGLAARALQQQGYTLRAARFGKAFPLGIKAAGVEIADSRGPLLKAQEMALNLDLLALLTGKLSLSCRATIGSGRFAGEYSPRDNAAAVDIRGVRLDELPFIETVTGARAKGVMRLRGKFTGREKRSSGELQLEVTEANVAGVKIGELPLPDADYRRIQGVVRVGNGTVTLGSFTLEGDGLYVRLRGEFPLTTPQGSAPLNLALELMPKPDFLERQKFVFLLLTKYLTSPGHYEIPIRGTFSKPAIQ
ncbi:MAG TPA: type II secretion system protein GspN [Geobacteraceae bacterium]